MRKFLILTLSLLTLMSCSKGSGPLVIPGDVASSDAPPISAPTSIPQAGPSVSCSITMTPNAISFQTGQNVSFGAELKNPPAGLLTSQLKVCVKGKKSTDGGATFTTDAVCSTDPAKPDSLWPLNIPGPLPLDSAGLYQRWVYIYDKNTNAVICDQSVTPSGSSAVTSITITPNTTISTYKNMSLTVTRASSQYMLTEAPEYIISGAPPNALLHWTVNIKGRGGVALPTFQTDNGTTDSAGHADIVASPTVPGQGGVWSLTISAKDSTGTAYIATTTFRVMEIQVSDLNWTYHNNDTTRYFIFGAPPNLTLYFTSWADNIPTGELNQPYYEPGSTTTLYHTDIDGLWSSYGNQITNQTTSQVWRKQVRVGPDLSIKTFVDYNVVP